MFRILVATFLLSFPLALSADELPHGETPTAAEADAGEKSLETLQPPTTTAHVDLTMVTATSIGEQLPFVLFEGQEWQAAADSKQVKLHMYFSTPFLLESVEASPCSGYTFETDASAYVNFDQQWIPLKITEAPAIRGFLPPSLGGIEARSVTINFHNNKAPCLSSVRFHGPAGVEMAVRVPRRVAGTVTASDTLEPAIAYSPYKLFDSRYEYAWATDGKEKGVHLDFNFEEAQSVSKIAIANGYQRSDLHCWKNSRPKTVLFTGDGDYRAEVQISDLMGTQVIELPSTFTGQKLRMEIAEAYSGKKWRDLSISELRLGNENGWFLVSPYSHIKESQATLQSSFDQAGVGDVLGASLEGTAFTLEGGSSWTLRLRPDGSFYLQGFSEKMGKEEMMDSTSFFAIGSFEVKSSKGPLKLRLFGSLQTLTESYPMGMDCNGCGRDCSVRPKAPDGSSIHILSEVIAIEANGEGYVMKNVDKSRDLDFKTMEMTLD